MKLSELEIPTETVEVPGGTIAVRGLGLPDLTYLLRYHGEALEGVYLEKIVSAEADPEAFNMAALARAVMEAAPMAVAQAVALAADEPDMATKVARLSIPTQIEAIEKVLVLTFPTEESVGNVLRAVLRGSRTAQNLMAGLNQPFETGNALSAAQ